jgi:plastocyanin
MKKALIPAVSVLILGLVLIGCGKVPGTAHNTSSSGCNGTVQMASSSFVQSTCTVHAGASVNFVDPQGTGGYHLLCLGAHQQCTSNPDGPAELNVSGGVVFNQGDSHSYVFAKPGTYTVTCTVHPGMDVNITVQ